MRLASFITSAGCVTLAAIQCFYNLITNTGSSASKYELFDSLLKKRKKTRSFHKIVQRRFGNLSSTCAATLNHWSDIAELVNECLNRNLRNQLVDAAAIYLETR